MRKIAGQSADFGRFSVSQKKGRHFTTLSEEANEMFLRHCQMDHRDPPDLLRIIVEDYYTERRSEARKFTQIIGRSAEEHAQEVPRYGPVAEVSSPHIREPIADQGQT